MWTLLLSAALAAPTAELTLAEAVSQLHDEAPSMALIAARAAEARATVKLATAPLLPVLVSQAGVTRNNAEVKVSFADVLETITAGLPFEVDTSALGDPLIIQPLALVGVGAQLNVPLFDGRAWVERGAALRMAESADASAEQSRLAAEAGLVKACFLSTSLASQLDAARRSVEEAAGHRERAARRLTAGVGTDLDVAAADVEIARRQGQALQAEVELGRAQRLVGALTGLGGAVRCVTPPATAEFGAADASVSALPGVRAAAASSEAASRGVQAAWWRHAPTLSANASVAWQSVDFPTGLPYAWKVGLNLTWVLFDGGARYAVLDTARARSGAAHAAATMATLDAERAIGDASDAVRASAERVELASVGVQAAGRAVLAAEHGWEAGVVTGLEVLDAQQRLFDARAALAASEAGVGVAMADLALASGRAAGAP